MITTRVKAACPAANEIIDGAMPESSTTSGNRIQRKTAWSANPIMMTDPTMNPTAVPPMARRAVAPVPRALERNTDMVPSTTQKPCWTFVISTTPTARARPTAPRRALRNQTERNERCDTSLRARACGAVSSAIPRRRPLAGSAPAASSVASATISVAIPSARAWKPGSSAPAMLSFVADPSSASETGAASESVSKTTSASRAATIT